MGWTSDDGVHRGYIEAVFADGQTSDESNGSGMLAWECDAAGKLVYEQRSFDEVVGWRLRCNCYEGSTHMDPMWEGLSFQRAATPTAEDLDNGLIFVPAGHPSNDVSDREDVGLAMRSRWLSEHVSPIQALDTIRSATAEIVAATQRLNQAVAYARAVGQTWPAIGRAAGMSRREAEEHWSYNCPPAP